MSPVNRVTRETFLEGHLSFNRSVLAEEVDSLLLSDEPLATVNNTELQRRLATSFLLYAHPGDESHPRIEVVPFTVNNDGGGEIDIYSLKLTGEQVFRLRDYMYPDPDDLAPPDPSDLQPYTSALRDLAEHLFRVTKNLAEAPGALLWHEAVPSQFAFIPANEQAFIDGQPFEAGPTGTFVLLDVDPRFIPVEPPETASAKFYDKLDMQCQMLFGEANTLAEMTGDTDIAVHPDQDVLTLSAFNEHCLLSRDFVQFVITAAAA